MWGVQEEVKILHGDLRRMFRWSQDWQMLFNLESAQLSIWTQGETNSPMKFGWCGKILRVSEKERVFGVIMPKSAKP